jgi:hypothetical protein
VDLVAALPYAMALAAISTGRWRAAATGAALTVAWLAALRFATPLFASPYFTWAATLGTIATVSAWRWNNPVAQAHGLRCRRRHGRRP